MIDNIALAEQFFKATATGDRRLLGKICDPAFQGKQNNGPTISIKELADYSLLVLNRVQDFRYENVVRASTDKGFVEEHDVCCSLNDQTEFRLSVCVVADVVNNKIVSVREYADSRAAKKLIDAISKNISPATG